MVGGEAFVGWGLARLGFHDWACMCVAAAAVLYVCDDDKLWQPLRCADLFAGNACAAGRGIGVCWVVIVFVS